MADIYTGYRNHTRFYLTFNVAQQDIPGNRSLINWTVGVQGESGWTAYWYSNAIRVNSVYVDNQGNLASGTWSNITLSNGQSVPLRSGSVWVYHNSDGTKSINASLSGWLYGYGDVSASGSLTLPTIPRNSQVSTDKNAYTLGDAITVITNRKSTSFTHTITIRKDNSSGTILKTFNSVGDAVTWTPTSDEITTMQNLIPSSNTLVIFIDQYNNQVGQSSNVTRNLTLTEANPIFTDFTYKDSNASVTAITGNDQVLVKGQSTLETTVSTANKMTAIKGSTADHYTVTYDGTTEQEAYSTSNIVDTFTPNTIGQRTILVTAFDSRGNNTSVSKLVTVYDYLAPTIESTLTRENNFDANTTIHLEGKWTPLTISGVNKNALTTGSLEYRYKEDGGTFGGWTSKTFTVTGDSWTISTDFVVSLDNTKKYIFEFHISDKFGTVTTTGTVDIGQPLMFVGENNGSLAIGIGKMPTNGALDVNGDIYTNGQKVATVTTPSYVAANLASNTGIIADTNYNITGLQITLPTAGAWFISANCRTGASTTAAWLEFRIYNSTAGVDADSINGDSQFISGLVGAGNVQLTSSKQVVCVTTTTNNIIQLQARKGEGDAPVLSDSNGRTSLTAFRIG